jgi:hypothetical protein
MKWDEEVSEDDLRVATRRYLPETVVWTTDWTTGALIEQISRNVFDVDPPFQRRSAWDDKKASLYIESLLLGCPVPAITLAELATKAADPRQYVVIDGKQRLGALKRFAIDESLRLTGLETLTELNGLRFRDIARLPEFARFENLPIRTVIMRHWQKDEVLQFVFHRLNTQVTPLSTHELRRALLAGPFTVFLDERSATSAPLKRILNISEPDYRLRDAELLLRAIAFSLFFAKYRGNLKQFLDTTTKLLNRHWSELLRRQLVDVCDELDAAMVATFEIFGEDAFQRVEDGAFLGRFNRAVFDIMVLGFRIPEVREKSGKRHEDVKLEFLRLMEDQEFSRFTAATTKSGEAVEGRVRQWVEALGRVLEIKDLYPRVTASQIPSMS